MCTALEELRNEGILEGIQDSVLKLLRKGFSVLEVANLLELSEEEVLEIQKKA